MANKILIPTPLRAYTGKREAVEVEGSTVGEMLADLASKHEGLRRHLFGDDGRLRSFVNVYLNDDDIRYLQREATPVKAGDKVSIIPSVAGGVGAPAPVETLPGLSRDEVFRYSRHLLIPEVGMEGQRKLKAARVLSVGAGGLGSPVSMYLAAAGIGTIGIVDFDTVDLSNLQRQLLHSTSDVGRPKLDSATDRLNELNPGVRVEAHRIVLTSENALDLIGQYDIVIDGTDNFPTRYLINDACVMLGKPCVYGSIFRFEGQVSVFAAKDGPCYRCLYPEPPPPGLVPSCAEGGVLGVLPGVIGTIQATEAIKLIIGAGEPLVGRLLVFDALKMRFRELKLRRDSECPVCGDHPTIREPIDYEQFCGVPRAGTAEARGEFDITAGELKHELDEGRKLLLLDVREPSEYQINRIPGSTLVPLAELPERLDDLGPDPDIVAYCKVGSRSATAVELLRAAGFRARNLAGGIVGWIDKVDPNQLRY
jgi:adenylyltransferase/sulfurtransferase